MKDLQAFKKEAFKNPKLKHKYDELGTRFTIISQLIAARIRKGVTQQELAQKVGTTQSSIARLEGGNINPSLDFLEKIAQVLGHRLTIHLN